MSYSTCFSKEYYRCQNCGKKSGREISKTWKCPDCDEILIIYTTDNNKVYLRKFGEDIVEDDQVKIGEEHHRVLDIKYKDGKYRIALEGYTVISLPEDEWLNCIWGAWNGDIESL
jgi:phage FluMu protein Com